MKKYIFIMLAAVMLAGCEKINEEAAPVIGTVTQEASSETETVTETESSVTEITEAQQTTVTEQETETDTEAAVLVGGEIEETTAAVAEEIGVESISLTFYEVTLQVGQSKMPIVTMLPENAYDKTEIWESSAPEIASVDGLGRITALSEGSCTVTVKSAQNPDVRAEVKVTVTAGPQVTYIDGILIANKTYALPADYAPGVSPDAQAAFDVMQADAAAQGLNLYISSGYRSYDYQSGLYKRYVERSGKTEADRYSARPGHSEHQTGLAFDLNTITDEFKDTDEGKWVAANCHKYGFIIRYPADKESVTGYMYEPWHIRYLGVETAQAVYESGLCLEEYLGITSEYAE